MASLPEISLTVLNTDDAVQKVVDLVLPQLRAEFAKQLEAQRIAIGDLGTQVNQLRRAVEATDKRTDQAHMRLNVLTNKATSIDNRLATHNNVLVEHRDQLEGLFNDVASLKGKINEVVSWQAEHEDKQEQAENDLWFQLVDLRRRARALEDIAVSHDNKVAELQDWRKAVDADVPLAVELQTWIVNLRRDVFEALDTLQQMHGQRLGLQAERQAKTDQFDYDMARRVAVVERTLLAQIDAAADLTEAVANLTTQASDQGEQLDSFEDMTVDALTDLGARLADLEDSFSAHITPAEEPPPQPRQPIYGTDARMFVNGAEIRPLVADEAGEPKTVTLEVRRKLPDISFDFKIDQAFLKAYRESLYQLNSQLFFIGNAAGAFAKAAEYMSSAAPVEPASKRCPNGCCSTCAAMGKPCHKCGQPTRSE